MRTIRKNKFAFSISLNMVVTIFIFIVSNPLDGDGVGLDFFALSYLAHWILLTLAGTSLFLRLVRLWGVPDEFEEKVDFISNPHRLLYVFLGITNVWFGLIAIFIYLECNGIVILVMETFLPNVVIGAILLTDTIRSKKLWNKRQQSIS